MSVDRHVKKARIETAEEDRSLAEYPWRNSGAVTAAYL